MKHRPNSDGAFLCLTFKFDGKDSNCTLNIFCKDESFGFND